VFRNRSGWKLNLTKHQSRRWFGESYKGDTSIGFIDWLILIDWICWAIGKGSVVAETTRDIYWARAEKRWKRGRKDRTKGGLTRTTYLLPGAGLTQDLIIGLIDPFIGSAQSPIFLPLNSLARATTFLKDQDRSLFSSLNTYFLSRWSSLLAHPRRIIRNAI